MSEGWAPGIFVVGLLVLAADSCDSRTSSRVRSDPTYTVAQPPAQPEPEPWDERSDCAPGAPPNSLANALDPLRAHCDRARAVAILAQIGAMALPIRGVGGSLAGGSVSRSTLMRAGVAGVRAGYQDSGSEDEMSAVPVPDIVPDDGAVADAAMNATAPPYDENMTPETQSESAEAKLEDGVEEYDGYDATRAP